MAKLIMWNVTTLDGYFEGEKPWDLYFHEYVWGSELEQFCLDQLANTGHLLFGRKTYEGMADYWKHETGLIANYMNTLPKVVCSTSLDVADWNNSTLIKKNASEEVAALKKTSEKDIYVFGSANLSHTLIEQNLFDEYRICMSPVIAGKGKPLFLEMDPKRLSLLSTRTLSTGGVIHFYEPWKEGG